MNVQSRIGSPDRQSDAGSMPPPSGWGQISFIEIWHVARIRSGVILGAALATFALITLIDLSLTPLYKGTSVVMIDERQNKVVNVEDVLSGLPTDQASLLSQLQVLQSRDLAWQVITRLGLDKDPEFNTNLKHSSLDFLQYLNPLHYLPKLSSVYLSPQEKQKELEDLVINHFEKHLDVSQVQLSTAIEIDFQSEDPAKAARIADTLADAYVDDQLNAKFEATVNASKWLASRLGQLAQQVKKSQDAVEEFKAANHITEVTGPTGVGTISVLDQQIQALNTQLVQAHTDVAQAEANLARVRSLVSSGRATEVTQVVGSTLISQLIQQQAQLIQQQAQMSTRYGPKDPKMIDLQAEKHDLDAKIQEEISHVVGTAENDVAVARARENSLQVALNQLESQSTVQGKANGRLHELESNVSASQTLYDTFVQRAKETQQQEGLQIPDARVISRSPIPIAASFPNNIAVFSVAVFAALFVGLLVAFVLERLDYGFRTAARVEDVLGLPVLASIPDVEVKQNKKSDSQNPTSTVADLVVDRPLSSYAEAMRGLQLGISLANVDTAPKVVIVTSALPGEGKTTTALSLARHVAQTGQKVVLIDGDLRRPTVKAAIGLPNFEFDLIDVLRGDKTVDEVLIEDPRSTVKVLPVIKQVKNAPDLVESQAFANTLSLLRHVFDMVIIDSAPVLPVTDTKVLSRLADSVLFVVRWEATPRQAAQDAIKSLSDVNVQVAGVALTRADMKRLHYYSFGYGSYYGYGYSYAKYYEG